MQSLTGPGDLDSLLGFRDLGGQLFNNLFSAFYGTIFVLVAMLLLQILLRRLLPAAIFTWAIFTTIAALSTPGVDLITFIIIGVIVGTIIFLIIRFGMVAGAATQFALMRFFTLPSLPDPSAWHAFAAGTTIAGLTGLAILAFYLSLAGRSVIADDLLEDSH